MTDDIPLRRWIEEEHGDDDIGSGDMLALAITGSERRKLRNDGWRALERDVIDLWGRRGDSRVTTVADSSMKPEAVRSSRLWRLVAVQAAVILTCIVMMISAQNQTIQKLGSNRTDECIVTE